MRGLLGLLGLLPTIHVHVYIQREREREKERERERDTKSGVTQIPLG